MVICCYIDLTTIQYNNTLSHDQCSRYKEHLLYHENRQVVVSESPLVQQLHQR